MRFRQETPRLLAADVQCKQPAPPVWVYVIYDHHDGPPTMPAKINESFEQKATAVEAGF